VGAGARLAAGLTQVQVALACGLAALYISRIERGAASGVSLHHLARILSVVGLDLTARAYPAGSPLRDAAHIALLGRLGALIAPCLTWRAEVPLPNPGDLRAWDAMITLGPPAITGGRPRKLPEVLAGRRRPAMPDRLSALIRSPASTARLCGRPAEERPRDRCQLEQQAGADEQEPLDRRSGAAGRDRPVVLVALPCLLVKLQPEV